MPEEIEPICVVSGQVAWSYGVKYKFFNASSFIFKIYVFWPFTFLCFFLQHKNRFFFSKFLALTLLLLFHHLHVAAWEAQSYSIENAFPPAHLDSNEVVVCFPPDIYMACSLQVFTQKSPHVAFARQQLES